MDRVARETGRSRATLYRLGASREAHLRSRRRPRGSSVDGTRGIVEILDGA
jgi:hypothetical protein